MKKTILKTKILLIFLLISCTGFSQNPWLPPFDLGIQVEPDIPTLDRAQDCSNNSFDYVDNYDKFKFYLDHYSERPVTTIMINFNIWQKDDGSGNWENTPDHIARLQSVVNHINDIYNSNCTPSDPISGVTDISDSKIRFELNEIYFYQNTTIWNEDQSGPITTAMNNVDNSRSKELNIHITGGTHPQGAAGFSLFPQYSNNLNHYVVTFNNEHYITGDWAFGSHLAHELGHSLDLRHTYGSSTNCDQTSDDYLDDIFGIGSSAVCPHDAGYNCDPNSSINSCTNNLMGGIQSGCYFSPKQIAIMHKALALKSIRKHVKCEIYSAPPIIISNSETWDFDIKFYNSIQVDNNATLTIKCKVSMSNNSKIIVKQGGQLLVDGGTITNVCGDFWQGIEVKGNPTANQVLSNQGKVELRNQALIEHAHTAVQLKQGGILAAYNSFFLNNRRAVEFLEYNYYYPNGLEASNQSKFVDVDFIWDNDYRHVDPLAHVTLWSVSGVKFRACDFADNRDNPDSPWLISHNNISTGVGSIDASYNIQALCTDFFNGCSGALEDDPDWQPSTFTNLDFGIYASNSMSERSIIVDRSTFKNNLYAIDLVRSNSPTITRNKFIIDNNNNHYSTLIDYQSAVHFVRTGGITIEENLFENQGSPNDMIGIISSDLGEADNVVYKNIFTNLGYGNVTQGKNRNITGIQGLQFLCNTNTGNRYDYRIKGTLWDDLIVYPQYGVKHTNGGFNQSSGNVFTQNSSVGEDYINGSSNFIGYFYETNSTSHAPIETSGHFFSHAQDQPNECPSRFGEYTNNGIAEMVVSFGSISTILQTNTTTYTGLVDGGSTNLLLQEVANLTSSNQATLRQTLIGNSPYLSKDVIQAVLQQPTSLYPEVWGYELILDNIDVVHEPNFIEFLSNKTEPMATWMIENIQIFASNNAYTDKFEKAAEISSLSADRSFNTDVIIRTIKNDSIVDTDTLRYWIEQKSDVLAQTQIIDTYLQDNNLTMAQSKVDALQGDIVNYSNHLHNELNDFVNFKNKLIELLEEPEALANLSQADHDFMTNLAETGTGVARYQAQEILCFFYHECATYSVDLDNSTTKSAILKEITAAKTTVKKDYTIYPNPANTWLAIELPLASKNIEIIIQDITGRVIFQEKINKPIFVWETGLLSSGTYIITISSNESIVGTEKIIIKH